MKKPIITLVTLMFAAIGLNADNALTYSYDAAGNRVLREIRIETPRQGQQRSRGGERLDDRVAGINISFSPNPTKGMLHVEIQAGSPSVESVSLFSMSGTLLQTAKGETSMDFDLSDTPSGIYLLVVQINGERTSYKVIKE